MSCCAFCAAARLTQRDLSIAVGYNFAHLSRLEQGQRAPDPIIIAATFVPALDLAQEPAWAARLVELAEVARAERYAHDDTILSESAPSNADIVDLDDWHVEWTPEPRLHEVARPGVVTRLHARLLSERHVALCGLAGIGKTTVAAALAREYAQTVPVCWLTFAEAASVRLKRLCAS